MCLCGIHSLRYSWHDAASSLRPILTAVAETWFGGTKIFFAVLTNWENWGGTAGDSLYLGTWLSGNLRVQTPGYIPKKNLVVFWVHPPKKPTPKKPHFYFNLIVVYTLYATNNALFYCFKAFEALSYWVFVLFYLFFPACPKNPKNQLGWAFFLKTRAFLNPG